MHRLPVGGDHGHRKARDAYVEVGHRRAVDEAQPHTFAALEQARPVAGRSEEHTSELQSLMRISYAVFCLKKKKQRLLTSQNDSTIQRRYHEQDSKSVEQHK